MKNYRRLTEAVKYENKTQLHTKIGKTPVNGINWQS